MAQVSPPDFTQNDQRYWNENTPPEKIKAVAHPRKWRRYPPNVTASSENLLEKFEKLILNYSTDVVNDSLNEGYFESQSDIEKKETTGSLKDKLESFSLQDSFSVSSNGYSSNSCANDSSIFNSSEDDRPDSSTPHQSMVFNSTYKSYRPPDLVIEESADENIQKDIDDLAQYSPVRSPFPADTSNDSLFDLLFCNEDTPEPVRFETPPKGIFLKENDMKMVHLLKRFGLSHFAFIFVEQEIDVELFLGLNDEDLKEIGIKRNIDRNILLSVISECRTRLVESNN